MEGESGVSGSNIDELHSWDIKRDRIEGKCGVTRSIFDGLHSSGTHGYRVQG